MNYSPIRHIGSIFWKRRPVHLTVFLTKRCNADCPFCFYVSSGSNEDTDELSLDEIRKISSSIGDLLWLAFSGGEIFLRKDLVEITQTFYDNNRPSIILLPTNGLMPEVIREKVELILKYCRRSTVVVKLSLEGSEHLHDSIRGKDSFRKTMQTCDALGDLLDRHPNFELGVNTVFSSLNQDGMEDLIEFVSKLKNVKTHTVSMIRGNVADTELKNININKYRDTIDRLASNLRHKIAAIYSFKGAKLKAAQDILQRRLIYDTVLQNRQLIPCYAGKLNIVLTETGDVYPCESFTPEKKMGNIKSFKYDLKKVLKTDQARNVVRPIQQSCFCTHECYLMTNILFNPRMYPALFREYLKI